jgi:hypothetical protein
MVKERGMKHPSQRSGPPGRPPGPTEDRTADQTTDQTTDQTVGDDGPAVGAGGAGGAGGPAGDGAWDQRPQDLLAVDLEALRAELEALAGAEPIGDADERADAVRERYSELLEDYGDDAEALTRIRALGRRIKDLEEAEILPRSLIRRGRSRR